MDVWLNCLTALLSLEGNNELPCSLLRAGGRLVLTERSGKAQTGLNHWLGREKDSPRYFLTVNHEASAYLYFTPGLHFYLPYRGAQSIFSMEACVLEESKVPPTSSFLGHGYVQQVGKEERGEHYVWYRTYLALKIHDVADAVAFSYGDCTAFCSKNGAVTPERTLD